MLASAAFWWPGWRETALGLRAVAAVVLLSAGATAGLGGAHLVVVIGQLVGRAYDFRGYALVLLGVVLVVPALVCVLAAPGLVRGERRAWRAAMLGFAALAMVNVPLMPLQGFAIALSAAAALGLLVLFGVRGRYG